jgi:hypothetical protein
MAAYITFTFLAEYIYTMQKVISNLKYKFDINLCTAEYRNVANLFIKLEVVCSICTYNTLLHSYY